jgi:hypothetical protein
MDPFHLGAPLARTDHVINACLALGVHCRRVVTISVRPALVLVPLVVGVRGVSTRRVGLVSDRPLQPDAQLAILWNFGLQRSWRTVHACVARVAPVRTGGWLVTCAIREPLEPEDVEAFLTSRSAPAANWCLIPRTRDSAHLQ